MANKFNINKTTIVILCGGYGSRMGKITQKLPKPLIEINGEPIIAIKIKKYYKLGFKNFVICIGYKGELIKRYLKNFKLNNIKIQYVDSGKDASMLKRIYNSKKYIDNHFILTYGDTISNINLKDFCLKSIKNKTIATIVLSKFKNPYGLVDINSKKLATSFIEKPVEYNYIGYCFFRESVFNFIDNKYIINLKDSIGLIKIFKMLTSIEQLSTYCYTGYNITFNTKADLKNNYKTL